MIQKAPSYITEDGTPHTTIEAAQQHELAVMAEKDLPNPLNGTTMANFILAHAAAIRAILKSTGRKERTKKAAKAPRKSTLKAGEII